MAVRATFANPARSTINLWIDADSVRPGLPIDDPEVTEFVTGGGIIEPYEVPSLPPTLDQIDTKALNAILVEDGSILRAVIAVLRSEINIVRAAVVPALPPRTVAQVTAALKAQMRT